MRKLAAFFVFLAVFCLSLSAQGTHEIELSVAGPVGGIHYANNEYVFYDTRTGNTLTDLYEDVEYHTSNVYFTLDYSYALKSWLRVGAEFGFGTEEVTTRRGLAYNNGNDLQGKGVTHLTLMPMVKIPYWDGMWINAYGRAAAGFQLATDWGESWKGGLAWEVVPFGLYYGRHNLKYIYEIGIGNVYLARFGVSVQF